MKKEPEVLYVDKDIVVVNKPAGIKVHPDGVNKDPCLTNWIIREYPETRKVGETIRSRSGEEIARPGIVHRLDRDTSGAVLVARTERVYEHLKSQFKKREIEKTYHAFVYGAVKKNRERIERPIGKSAKNFHLWSAQRGARGHLRDAVTEYKVLTRGEDVSFLQVSPLTGRTHQIRVHMKAVNHPVVCDPLYAPNRGSLLGFERTALHASGIKFKTLKDESLSVKAPFPEDFQRALNILGIDVEIFELI